MSYEELLALLIAAHFLCDHPLQGPYLALGKNPSTADPSFPWWHAMIAHCAIHAGAVVLLTHLWWLGLFEFLIHFATDYAKCRKWISLNIDQTIHLACKIVWATIAIWWFA